MRYRDLAENTAQVPTLDPQPLACEARPKAGWSIDFMSNALWDGRGFNHLRAESLTSDRRWRIQEGSHHKSQLLQGDALTILPTL